MVENSLNAELVPYNEKNKNELASQVTGFPKLIFPPDLGNQGRNISVPFKIQNFHKMSLSVRLAGLNYRSTNILRDQSVSKTIPPNSISSFDVPILLPQDLPLGKTLLPVTLIFDDDPHISPVEGTLSFTYTGDMFKDFSKNASNYLFIIIIVIIAAVLALLVFVIIRMRVFENIFKDILSPGSGRNPQTGMFGELIEMRVAFQNPHVGFRNIHKVEEGKKASVGGGLSTFLIFLIPIPSNIAEVSKEGDTYVFTPLKEEFFPELHDSIVDCLEKDIQIVSKQGYRSAIRFHKYISPLTELNHLLHSASHETQD
jgi:hypothetical protein